MTKCVVNDSPFITNDSFKCMAEIVLKSVFEFVPSNRSVLKGSEWNILCQNRNTVVQAATSKHNV